MPVVNHSISYSHKNNEKNKLMKEKYYPGTGKYKYKEIQITEFH